MTKRSKFYLDAGESNGAVKVLKPADPKKLEEYKKVLESRKYKNKHLLEKDINPKYAIRKESMKIMREHISE